MFEIVRYESSRRVRGSAIMAVAIGVVALFFATIFPSFEEAGAEDIAEAMPPALREAFGVDAIGTIEGFLATEIYSWIWVLLVGIYFAYAAAGAIARDVESGGMDLLLSYPVSRRRVLVERFAALGVPLLLLNTVVPVLVYLGVVIAGESIEPTRLVMVHALSVPFFLVCAGIGVLLSVVVSRVEIGQRIAAALVFFLWLFASITATVEDLDWIGAASPTRYYDPTAILVHGTYDLIDAGILVAGFAGLVAVSLVVFERRDV